MTGCQGSALLHQEGTGPLSFCEGNESKVRDFHLMWQIETGSLENVVNKHFGFFVTSAFWSSLDFLGTQQYLPNSPLPEFFCWHGWSHGEISQRWLVSGCTACAPTTKQCRSADIVCSRAQLQPCSLQDVLGCCLPAHKKGATPFPRGMGDRQWMGRQPGTRAAPGFSYHLGG